MKKVGLIGFSLCFIFAKVASQAGNPVVVIAPFEAHGIQAEEANVITEMFTSAYASAGLANVVDRNSFDKIKKELSFQASDWSNNDKVAELGRALNANQVVIGTITSFRGQVIVSIKVIDINSTTILASQVEKLREIDDIVDRMPKICKTLANKARSANKKGSAKNSAATIFDSIDEKRHSFYIAPVLGYDSFIVGNTCSLGVDFKYKHKSGFSVWANNAILLGKSRHKHIQYTDYKRFIHSGQREAYIYDYKEDYRSFFSGGASTEIMIGYSQVFGKHNIGIGIGYQGAYTKRFFESYAIAVRFEYAYIFKKNLGIIISLTDGVGSIQHARDTYTEKHNVEIKEKDGYYETYKRYDNVEIIKNTKAGNRFSIKLGIVFTT